MIPLLVDIWLGLAVFGLGSLGLAGLGLFEGLSSKERLVFVFPLGIGLLGWTLFWLGAVGGFSVALLAPLLTLPLIGLGLWRQDVGQLAFRSHGLWDIGLWGLTGASLVLHLSAVLLPPTDADSLTYHFVRPRQWVELGGLDFVARAVDGATALLVQVTYVPPLMFAGEGGLTLWMFILGLMLALSVWALARLHMGAWPSGAVVLILLTTPAVVYGLGAGQVEVKNALFAVAGAWAAARAVGEKDTRLLMLAGLLAGFFCGGKYLGLLFVAVTGLAVLMQPRWFRAGTIFGLAVLAAGGQWYLWNAIHVGDPVFPMGWSLFGTPGSPVWNGEAQAAFKLAMTGGELVLPRDPLSLIAYPFLATFSPDPVFESGRTGLGPFAMMALPFVGLVVYRRRGRVFRHPLSVMGLIVVGFYVAWFLSGSSQRIRHLLPVLPAVLILGMVAMDRILSPRRGSWMLMSGVLAVAGLQIAGQAVFSINGLDFILGREDRAAYLDRNVEGYTVAEWLNGHLPPGAKLALTQRNLLYYLEGDPYLLHPTLQTLVNVRRTARDADLYHEQLRAQGVTHLLVEGDVESLRIYAGKGGVSGLTGSLLLDGRAEVVREFKTRQILSRTLSQFDASMSYGIAKVLLRVH